MKSKPVAPVRRGAPAAPSRRVWPTALLVAITLAVYANALGLGFVWDDNYQILRNYFLRDPHYIPKIFTSAFWDFLNPNQVLTTNFYRPMQSLIYMLCYQIFGLEPWGFHLVSLLLHLAATLMAYGLLRRWGVEFRIAWVAALLFAVHPIHTESVAWVAGVPDVLCAFFYFLAFYLYMGWRRQPAPRRAGGLVGAGAAFFLALLSKEMALTFPLVVLAREWLFRDEPGAPRGKAWLIHLGPFVAVVAVYLLVRWGVLGFFATTQNALPLGSLDLMLLRVIFIFDYVIKAVLPAHLNAHHLVRLSGFATDWRLLGGLGVLALAGWVVVRERRSAPQMVFGILWFFITLAPVLHIRAVSASLFAERYLYIPSLGVCLLLALGSARLAGWLREPSEPKRRARAFAGAVGLMAALFSIGTVRRNFDWKDNIALFSKTAEASPYSALVHNTLGMEYVRDPKQLDRAQAEFEAALGVLNLGYHQSSTEAYTAYIGLGVAQFQKRNYAAAQEAFTRALALNPNREWAYSYLGAVRIQWENKMTEGLALLRKALTINPNNEITHNLMGIALFNAGQYAAAAAEFQTALQILPNSAESREYLKLAQAQLRRK